ncbi:chemotaxis protein [bacterium]|nr:chemotaxis protein [bacterium]
MPVRRKLAVAIVHGVGKQEPDFAEPMIGLIRKYFAREVVGMPEVSDAEVEEVARDALVVKPVYWEPVIQGAEDELWKRMKAGGPIRWRKSRRYAIDYGGDALAYQETPWDRTTYDEVHKVFASALNALAHEIGENAPLCVIAHSLGTVIASNYFYDLAAEFSRGNKMLGDDLRALVGNTALEHGETLALFYTMGSPLAVFALRYGIDNFGTPTPVPAESFGKHFPKEKFPDIFGEWLNFYDPDDIIGYPLKSLNDFYAQTVTRDMPVNAGGLLNFWNPSCHGYYWTRKSVVKPIAQSLAKLYMALK